MKALIDGDVLRYEVGFAAETGWQQDGPPPWDYIESILTERLARICRETSSETYNIYLTTGHTFRYDIATTRPYKATRIENKPWHYHNLTVYMRDVLGAEVVTGIEADDAMSVSHLDSNIIADDTIICTRDKDLRQVPGWFYSWELGNQPSFGPYWIEEDGGDLWLSKKGLSGTGYAWFCAQLLMGDRVDNVPGLPGWGPRRTYDLLAPIALNEHRQYVNAALLNEVKDAYADRMGHDWEPYLLEQGQLLWMTRKLNEDGTPVLWELN